jgi:hypothetical protein
VFHSPCHIALPLLHITGESHDIFSKFPSSSSAVVLLFAACGQFVLGVGHFVTGM